MPTPKLVIDTNVLITTVNRQNPEYVVYQAFERKLFNWVVSTEVLAEYTEQLTAFYSENTANFVLDILCTATNVTFTEPYYRWGIIEEDPDDNKFADLAISAAADGLITFDKHFSIFRKLPFPTLRIVHPTKFRSFLSKYS